MIRGFVYSYPEEYGGSVEASCGEGLLECCSEAV